MFLSYMGLEDILVMLSETFEQLSIPWRLHMEIINLDDLGPRSMKYTNL